MKYFLSILILIAIVVIRISDAKALAVEKSLVGLYIEELHDGNALDFFPLDHDAGLVFENTILLIEEPGISHYHKVAPTRQRKGFRRARDGL